MILIVVGGLSGQALAQTGHHPVDAEVEATAGHGARAGQPMAGSVGSGTSWLPATTPVHGAHFLAGGFQWMVHGALYGVFNWQGTRRGETELFGASWIMAVASRRVQGADLALRGMLSADPLTMGGAGYSLLAQSGETFEGDPLIDRQHPHELFVELAAQVRRRVAGPLHVEVYGGPVGEPALGPVAFLHRPSGMPAPMAPLGHHWLDSTHITFGVVTAGVATERVKLEGSWFNGREPDDERLDWDLRGFDSVSVRLAAMPRDDVAAQVSWGYLGSPEALEPEVSVHRVTASIAHQWFPRPGSAWATTLAWGRNVPEEGPTTDAWLAESALDTGRYGVFFVRAEQVDKETDEMGIAAPTGDEARVHQVTVAHLHELGEVRSVRPGIGVAATVTHAMDDLVTRYGQSFLFGAMAYVTLRPAAARSHSMAAH